MGRAHADVVVAGAQLLLQPEVGVRNHHPAEIADHNLRREELTEEEEETGEEHTVDVSYNQYGSNSM
jgi:hypothetical protein